MEVLEAQNWTRWLVRQGASFCAKRLFKDGPVWGHDFEEDEHTRDESREMATDGKIPPLN